MPQLLLNILISGSLVFLVSLSFSYTYYPTRFFHIAHGAVIAVGAYVAYELWATLHWPLLAAGAMAMVIAIVIGLLCDIAVYSRMRKAKSPALSYLIASIGLFAILQNAISLLFGDDSKAFTVGAVRIGHNIAGAYVTTVQLVTIISSFILFGCVVALTKNTRIGRSIQAVSANPELSNLYGIDSNRVIRWSLAGGSALGAVAGILAGLQTNITPTMGFSLLVYGIVAMIIGGVGSMKGLLSGALVVASAQQLVSRYIDTKWMDAGVYVLLIAFLVWKPLGFSGHRLKKVDL